MEFDFYHDREELKELEKLAARRDYKIAIANDIIDEMREGLSAKQQKILDYMLKAIQPEDTPEKRYSFSIRDYCREFNIDYRKNSTNYQDIKAAVQSINNQSKWIDVDKHETVLVQWFHNVRINHDRGTIEYNIDETMSPYLFGLIKTGNYTTYTDRETGAFESKYTRPLYRLLKRYMEVDIYTPFLPIDKLRTLLAAEKYQRYPDFKRFVLDMATHEINQYSFIKVSYEPYKAAGSRATTHIMFRVEAAKGEEYREREQNQIRVFGEQELQLPF